jgi:hypothetical protein
MGCGDAVLDLTDDEAALLYHVQMHGSPGYPVAKLGKRWIVCDWRTVKGPPLCYLTRKSAVAYVEGWIDLALEKWREYKRTHPLAILTAVGIR